MLLRSVCVAVICCTGLGEATAAEAAGDESGLVLHLGFEEDGGAVARDASGRRNHGSVVGDAQRVPGKVGQAMSFDGETGAVDLGKVPDLDFDEKTSFTIAFWMQTTTTARWSNVLTKKLRAEPTEPGWQVYMDGRRIAFVAADGQKEIRLVGSSSVADGQWHHVAVVGDRAGDLQLFINGQAEDRKPMSGLLDLSNPRRHGRVGDRHHDGGYHGLLDEVKVYRAVMPPAPQD